MAAKYIVTGVAGFIGSSLAQRLLNEGNEIIGVDCLTDYYPLEIKQNNLEPLLADSKFKFIQKNISDVEWKPLLDGVSAVFHFAAQAGVRASWGKMFQSYTDLNVVATQVLLESLKDTGIRVVYSSSSSVYGDTDQLPMREDHLPKPHSPYGVTKLAAEHLCGLYWRNYKVSTVSLRYFTVYGPKQRPDMAFHRFLKAGIQGKPINLFGDGDQTRDFTFVDDVVQANISAATIGQDGGIYNIGGGSRTTVNNVIKQMEQIINRPIQVNNLQTEKGDVKHTYADTTRARNDLKFEPTVTLEQGLAREAKWVEERMSLLASV